MTNKQSSMPKRMLVKWWLFAYKSTLSSYRSGRVGAKSPFLSTISYSCLPRPLFVLWRSQLSDFWGNTVNKNICWQSLYKRSGYFVLHLVYSNPNNNYLPNTFNLIHLSNLDQKRAPLLRPNRRAFCHFRASFVFVL